MKKNLLLICIMLGGSLIARADNNEISADPGGAVECNVLEWDLSSKEASQREPLQITRACKLYQDGKFGLSGNCDFFALGLEVHVDVVQAKVDLITVTKGKITVESESETVKLYDSRAHHQYLVGCSVRLRQ